MMIILPKIESLKLDEKFSPSHSLNHKVGESGVLTPWLISDAAAKLLRAGSIGGPRDIFKLLSDGQDSYPVTCLDSLEDDFLEVAQISVAEQVGDFFALRLSCSVGNGHFETKQKSFSKMESNIEAASTESIIPSVLMFHAAIFRTLQVVEYPDRELLWLYLNHKKMIQKNLLGLIPQIVKALEVFYAYNGSMAGYYHLESPRKVAWLISLAFSPLFRFILPILDDKTNRSTNLISNIDAMRSVFFGLGIHTASDRIIADYQKSASFFGRSWSDQVVPIFQSGLREALI